MTGHGIAYRFTATDERRIGDALRDRYQADGEPRLSTVEVDGYVAIGAHAIDCSIHDLRDAEIQWIRNEIGEIELGI